MFWVYRSEYLLHGEPKKEVVIEAGSKTYPPLIVRLAAVHSHANTLNLARAMAHTMKTAWEKEVGEPIGITDKTNDGNSPNN